MANNLNIPEAPVLPSPAEGFIFSNILRLFFNRLVSSIRILSSASDFGGKNLYFPNGLFYSTQTQSVSVADTAQAVTFNQSYLSNGVSVVDSTKVTVGHTGIYNFQLSCELNKPSADPAIVYLWIRKNGVDTEYSTHTFHISGSDASVGANWIFNYDMQATDYIEMMLASDDTGTELQAQAPTSPHVGIPSAVMVVNFVSNV